MHMGEMTRCVGAKVEVPMPEDLVMRSVYLPPSEDTELRQLAFELNVSKNELIRSAVSAKLKEWRKSNSRHVLLSDLELGRRRPRG